MTDKNDKTPEDDMAAELLLKEADDSLRQEELQKLWKEWGATIIGVALMVVFGTMIGVGWKSWRTSVYEGQTQALMTMQQKGPAALATQGGELSGSYDAIAKMIAAGQLANTDGAPSQVTSSTIHNLMVDANDGGLPKYYDVMAQWTKLRTRFDATKDDDKQSIIEDMLDAADSRNNPFSVVMNVEGAMMYASMNAYDKALDVLNGLDDAQLETVPSLKSEVESYRQIYQAKLNKDEDK
jgi:predicted negative regulator of RcsB-dependent stress response